MLPRLVVLHPPVLLCALLCTLTAQAQPAEMVTLSGTVRDQATGEALPGAHVFIATSTLGTASGTTGAYRLDRVPLGAHRVYASMVGYAPAHVDTLLGTPGDVAIDLTLAPTVVEGPEVTVTAERDPRWPRRLRRFETLFLGESPLAEACTIVNPEVLDFDASWWGKFKADAVRPVVIENRALGYRVTYFLETFELRGTTLRYDGEPLFEELAPASPQEAEAWDTNRRRAYYGSLRHFLLALLEDRIEEEGYLLFLLPHARSRDLGDARYRTRAERLLEATDTPLEHRLDFPGFVKVVYLKEEEDPAFLTWQRRYRRSPGNQNSYIELTDGPTLVDYTGEVIDPFGLTTYGYFAFERIAELLPKDYRPDGPPP